MHLSNIASSKSLSTGPSFCPTVGSSKVRLGHPVGAAGGGAGRSGSGENGAAGWAVSATRRCTKFALQGEAAGDLAASFSEKRPWLLYEKSHGCLFSESLAMD